MLVDHGYEKDIENTQEDQRDNLDNCHAEPRIDGVKLGAAQSCSIGNHSHGSVGKSTKFNSMDHKIGQVENNRDKRNTDDEAPCVLSGAVLSSEVPMPHCYVALERKTHRQPCIHVLRHVGDGNFRIGRVNVSVDCHCLRH